MNQIEQSQLYTDFSGLDELRKGGLKNDEDALRKAAEHFESIFMKMMMKSMRQAEEVLSDQDSPFNSQTSKFYRDMHDDQMSIELSQTGALGLADLIVQQLSPNQTSYKPASTLRADGQLNALNNQIESNTLAENIASNQSGYSLSAQNNLSYQVDLTKQKSTFNLDAVERRAVHSQSIQSTKLDTNVLGSAPETSISSDKVTHSDTHIQFNSKQDFVDKLMPVAEKVAAKLGLPPAAMIAQAALETGWGQKMIQSSDGQNSLNFFGIKADNRWHGERAFVSTLEHRNGVAVQEKAHFRAYPSIQEALEDYTNFVGDSPRYEQAVSVAADPNAYFSELQSAGYATDPQYAEKIKNILQDTVFTPFMSKVNQSNLAQ